MLNVSSSAGPPGLGLFDTPTVVPDGGVVIGAVVDGAVVVVVEDVEEDDVQVIAHSPPVDCLRLFVEKTTLKEEEAVSLGDFFPQKDFFTPSATTTILSPFLQFLLSLFFRLNSEQANLISA